MVRVIHVIPSASQEASGPTYSVMSLAGALARAGEDVTVMSVSGTAPADRQFRDLRFSQDFARTPVLSSLRLSRGLRSALEAEASAADLIHNHSLWLAPNVYPGWAAAKANRPLVLSPRGTLNRAALSRSRGRKTAFWLAAQKRVVRQAALLHATSDKEYEEIRAFGLPQPVAVIPNGVDLPERLQRQEANRRRLLFLGRIHPIKGLESLIRAWAVLEPRFEDWDLVFVGPDEDGYEAELKALASRLGLSRVAFEGPAYGAAKDSAYAAADLYVLPSLTENFGMSVAEALAQETPVVASRGTPWSGLVAEGCGWWPEIGDNALAAALAEAMEKPRAELRAMGARGRAWMARDFGWSHVAAEMAAAYRWLLGRGERPAAVRID